jgi:hypothetical protein
MLDKIAALAADEREAYRAGYLAKMAVEGYSPDEADALLSAPGPEKRAGAFSELKSLLGAKEMMSWVGGKPSLGLSAIALGAPVALGGALGWGAASLTNPSDKDLEMLEDDVLANEYRHQTNALRADLLRRKKKPRAGQRSVGI